MRDDGDLAWHGGFGERFGGGRLQIALLGGSEKCGTTDDDVVDGFRAPAAGRLNVGVGERVVAGAEGEQSGLSNNEVS